MILFLSSSNREAAALAAACENRSWAAYICPTVREFRPLAEKIQPRAIVVRHRLIDGYSDDVFTYLKGKPIRVRPRVIVLMSAERTAQTEARQIALGADCVLHDPVRMEILLEYLAKYRVATVSTTTQSNKPRVSFSIAGVDVFPHEHRIVRGTQSFRIAPQEVALLRIFSTVTNEVVPYPVLYGELFGRRFDGDTANCRVLLCKVLASFKQLGVELRPFIQVIPKSGYLYTPIHIKSRPRSAITKMHSKRPSKSSKPRTNAPHRISNR